MKIYKILSLWASQLITLVLNFLVQVILANYYSVEDTGNFIAITYLMNILSTLGMFGINNYYIYKKAKDGYLNKQAINSLLKIFIIFNVLCAVIFMMIGYINYSQYMLLIISSTLMMVLSGMVNVAVVIEQFKEKLVTISIFQIIIPFIKVSGLVIGIAILNHLVVGYSLYTILINIILIIGFILFYVRNIQNSKKIDDPKTTMKGLIVVLAPYAFLNVFFLLYTQGNTLYVNLFSSPRNSAYFAISYLILNTIFIFPTAIFQRVLSHRLIGLIFNERDLFVRFFQKTQEFLILVSGPMILIIFIMSHYLIVPIFGERYESSIEILNLLIISIPFRFMTISIGNILNTDEHIKKRISLEIVVTIVNFLLNVSLIHLIGIKGAIISVVATELLLAIGYSMIVRNLFGIKNHWYIYLSFLPIVISIAVGANIWLVIAIEIITLIIIFNSIRKRGVYIWKMLQRT